MKGAQVWVLQDCGLVVGNFPALGGEVAALRRFAGGKTIRFYWRFVGGRFFEK